MDIETLEYEPIKLEGKSEKSKLKLEEVRVPASLREWLRLEKSLGSVKVRGRAEPIKLEGKSDKSKLKLEEVRVPARLRECLPLEKPLGSVKVWGGRENS